MNHKYSTVSLFLILGIIFLFLPISALESADLDEICAVDGSFLQRITGLWQCATIPSGDGSGGWTNNSQNTSTTYQVFALSTGANSLGIQGTGTAFGVKGISIATGTGVYGYSPNGYGMNAVSANNIGLYASSTNGYGIRVDSANNIGILASVDSSQYAFYTLNGKGYFGGNVTVNGSQVCTVSNWGTLCNGTSSSADTGGWVNDTVQTNTSLNVNMKKNVTITGQFSIGSVPNPSQYISSGGTFNSGANPTAAFVYFGGSINGSANGLQGINFQVTRIPAANIALSYGALIIMPIGCDGTQCYNITTDNGATYRLDLAANAAPNITTASTMTILTPSLLNGSIDTMWGITVNDQNTTRVNNQNAFGIRVLNVKSKFGKAGTPDAMLHVQSRAASDVVLEAQGGTSQTADLFRVKNNANATLDVITSTGSMGLGISIPTAKLEVAGNVNITQNLTIGQYFKAGECVGTYATGVICYNSTDNIMYVYNGSMLRALY